MKTLDEKLTALMDIAKKAGDGESPQEKENSARRFVDAFNPVDALVLLESMREMHEALIQYCTGIENRPQLAMHTLASIEARMKGVMG